MKKSRIGKYIFTFFSLLILLSSCNKNTKTSKENVESVDIKNLNIKYVKEQRQTFKNSSKKKDFEKIYGFGKYSDAIKINDSLGNLAAFELGNYNLGISLEKSSLASGAISAFVSYFDKKDEKLEKPKEIEFGPIWVDDPKPISNITFDKLTTASGDMLVVSLSVISAYNQYSAYYIYNKNMALVAYFSFSNSVSNISVKVESLDKLYYPDGNFSNPGSISEASKARVDMEEKILEEVEKTYGIKYKKVFQTVDGEKIAVAHFPQDSAKTMKIVTIESLTNLEKYPSYGGYFRIY
ncbi:MAG: hypothetical protein PUG67_03735 [Peptoniphilaceae bacterium]|nr:hypothetical protein [Peptoniphilaceae bacterium]MDY6019541.1 hypothetical protein [Anaerococcus sp.]